MLTIIETHPIQYRAPVYRMLSEQFNLPISVIYGSDFSVAGYEDREFGAKFSWDTDLLTGYSAHFLSTVQAGGAGCYEDVNSTGLASKLQELKPQVVLITGYNHRLHRSAFFLALRNKYPILFRGETTDRALERNYLKAWGRDKVLRWLYQHCDRLLYIGENSKSHYQRLGCPDSKLISSPYCVNPEPFQLTETNRTELRQQVRQQLKIADDTVVLIFSGKLSTRKRPDLIFAAIKQLPIEHRQKLAVIYLGDGELRSSLVFEAEAEPKISAYFMGFQNQTQLSQYYHAADLLVLPSAYSETWGLVVNEALHHGLPTILSDAVGCVPDLLHPGVTGEVFAVNSVASLSAAITRSLSLIDRLEIRSGCREHVSKYSISTAAAGIAQAYQSEIEK